VVEIRKWERAGWIKDNAPLHSGCTSWPLTPNLKHRRETVPLCWARCMPGTPCGFWENGDGQPVDLA